MTDPATGPHGHDFTPVVEALAPWRDEEVVFVPGPGNGGDGLINLGTYRFLDRMGIRHVRGEPGRRYPGRVVLHCGGGALVDLYPDSDATLRANHDAARALILLPHTVRTHGGLIAAMDGRCTLLARERPSLEHLAAHAGGARVGLAPDMAFALSDADIRAEPWSLRRLLAPRIRRHWPPMVAKFLWHARRDPVLRAMRGDVEAGAPGARGHMDLTGMFSPGDMSRPHCAAAIKAIRMVAAAHERVETDRLHMAVLAAIMGLPTVMVDNSYGKNRAVFEASIAGRFPHVRFRDAPARHPARAGAPPLPRAGSAAAPGLAEPPAGAYRPDEGDWAPRR